ncbi:phage head-tail connector protein [Anaplasma phagocytophilum]|uniref:head-tail connector protein n=1 Tax=Anaplasma phagocytophilum TaxID=948 RepID=UPI0020105D4E|nr:phage head-tail connector protein [Anaplasma phagocytophilum]UQD54670.1 phage head-tail connector protein [Anaplasma phagocytophilum]
MMENSVFQILRKSSSKEFPVSLEDAKLFLGINNNKEDALLRNLISISTEYAQWYIERSLMQQTWQLSYSGEVVPKKIYLPFGPLISVTSVNTTSAWNEKVTIKSNNYCVDMLRSSIELSSCLDSVRVEIVYSAGYLAPEIIPAQVRHGILHHTAISYKNRSNVDIKHMTFLKEMYLPFRELKLVL